MAWYDDLNQGIQQPSNKMGSVQDLRASMAAQQKQTAPVQTSKKNWLQDQISTGGGIAGSLGGAALGTVILPGIGTILGGILGGAFGAGGGQVAENAITGEKNLGKDVASEAIMGGIFGTPILKTGKALIGGGKALLQGAGKTAANTAVKEALGSKLIGTAVKGGIDNTLKNTGAAALGEAWGIRPGVKLSGKLVTPQSAVKLQDFAIKNIGVGKTASAKDVFSKTVSYLDNIGSGIDNAVKAIPENTINPKNISSVLKTKFNSMLGIDSNNQVAKDIISRVNASKTPSELWSLRKEIDTNLISWGRNPETAVTGATQIAQAARTEISNVLKAANPALKSLNSQYSKALNIIDLSAAATKTPKGFKIPGFQQTVGGGTAQSIKAGIGSGLNATGSLVDNITSRIPQGLVGTTARQVGGRLAFSPNNQQLDQTQTDMTNYSSPSGTTDMVQPQASTSPYPREALLYDIQRDPKNSAKYFDYYNNMQALYPEAKAKSYSSATAGTISDFQSSLSELNNMADAISSGPGTVDPVLGTLRSMNPYDVDQQTLQAMINKTRQIVGKALEGGVLRKEDEEKYKKILPTTGDTKAVALNKIEMIRNQINAKLQNYSSMVSGGSSTGNALEDALMQQQQQSNYNTGY